MSGTRTRDEHFRHLMTEYVERVRRLAAQDSAHYVLSRDAVRYAQPGGPMPEVVCFVDNPGVEEHRNGVFLFDAGTGRGTSAGRIAKLVFEAEFGPSYRDRVLILNKSNYHTPKTSDLARALKKMPSEERGRFKADMDANAHLVGNLAKTLGCPVVIAGTHKVFRGFFEAAMVSKHAGFATFAGRRVAWWIHVVPHFSYYKCFLKSAEAERWNPDWNQRVAGFLARNSTPGKALETKTRGISARVINKIGRKDPEEAARLFRLFFREVLLGIQRT